MLRWLLFCSSLSCCLMVSEIQSDSSCDSETLSQFAVHHGTRDIYESEVQLHE